MFPWGCKSDLPCQGTACSPTLQSLTSEGSQRLCLWAQQNKGLGFLDWGKFLKPFPPCTADANKRIRLWVLNTAPTRESLPKLPGYVRYRLLLQVRECIQQRQGENWQVGSWNRKQFRWDASGWRCRVEMVGVIIPPFDLNPLMQYSPEIAFHNQHSIFMGSIYNSLAHYILYAFDFMTSVEL